MVQTCPLPGSCIQLYTERCYGLFTVLLNVLTSSATEGRLAVCKRPGTEYGRRQQEKYVQELKEKLSQAYALADSHAKVRTRANKKRYDERVKKSGLDVGRRVLVRNVVVHQKQKLANHWLTDLYIVQRQQGGSSSPVYVV